MIEGLAILGDRTGWPASSTGMPSRPLHFHGHDFAAFLFDMDGTLLDSSAVVERVWREWAQRHGIEVDALMAVMHGVRAEDLVRRFARDGMDIAGEIDALFRAEMDDIEGVLPIAGINAFIERLDPARWAIVTSAPRELALRRIQAVGLPVPRHLVAAGDVTRGKPDPEGFLKAAEALGVPIGDCLVFEDSAAGLQAGRNAGARIVAIGGHVEAADALAVLADYRGL